MPDATDQTHARGRRELPRYHRQCSLSAKTGLACKPLTESLVCSIFTNWGSPVCKCGSGDRREGSPESGLEVFCGTRSAALPLDCGLCPGGILWACGRSFRSPVASQGAVLLHIGPACGARPPACRMGHRSGGKSLSHRSVEGETSAWGGSSTCFLSFSGYC